jgi:hypothetical protein
MELDCWVLRTVARGVVRQIDAGWALLLLQQFEDDEKMEILG